MTVTLVRVDTVWHVFEDTQDGWAFYSDWKDTHDCECLVEQYGWKKGEQA